jgi:uncharacterized protein (TIGR02246 family)
MITFILALTLLAAAPTPTPSAADMARAHKAEVQKAIDAGNAAYISTWQHGYAHSFALLYTEDAATVNGDGTITRGRADIEAAKIAEMRQEALLRGTIATEDLVVEDDIAYEMGSYSFTLKAPDKPETVEAGRYLTIWQRQPDGKWLIKTDAGLTNRNCLPVM